MNGIQSQSMAKFKDHFSTVASAYQQYRPHYPANLYQYLSSLAPDRTLAWDCATGSGQCAVELAKLFDRVIATDASADQIKHAVSGQNISYRVAPAEDSGLEKASVNLVTVAQAMHWFQHDKFFAEVKRVSTPGAVVAVWSYGLHEIDPAVDDIVESFYHHTVGPYWPPERRWIDGGVGSLPFPFAEITSPEFYMEAQWNLNDLLGYFSTWSAVVRYRQEQKSDPLPELRDRLLAVWGSGEKKIRWPISLRVGSVD